MIKPTRATGLERLELLRLRDRVGRLFAALQEATVAEDPLASGAWAPPVDLCETEDAIYVRVELPGLTADQIKIGLTNTQLRIWGEKKAQRAVAPDHFASLFRTQLRKFSRLVPLALDVQRARCDGGTGERYTADSSSQDRRSPRSGIQTDGERRRSQVDHEQRFQNLLHTNEVESIYGNH